MDINRSNKLRNLLALPFLIAVLCTSCSTTPGRNAADPKKDEVPEAYRVQLQAEADTYFTKLAEEALGSRPEEIRIGFRNENGEAWKESKPISVFLTGTDPVPLVGLISASEKGYSDDEIHKIIMEAKKQEIIVDLYFNYNDDYIYQVRKDGVVIDKATGKDGGAMREQIAYELAESEEDKNE